MSEYDYKRADGKPKTVIVTGGAGGIGAQTIKSFYSHNCNVVIADLPYAKETAENLIRTLGDSSRAMFVPANIVDWKDMQALFRKTKEAFGQVDVVIANAGLMESKGFYDFEEDESGELKEPTEAYRVLDVNLKGTMNSKPHSYGTCPPFALTTNCSGSASDALDEVKRPRRFRLPRLHPPRSVDLRLFRWHRCGFLHLFKAWCSRIGSLVTARGQSTRRASQCCSPILHTHTHHDRILGQVERKGAACQYRRGRGGRDHRHEHES